MSEVVPLNCQHCGVCCFSGLDTYVRVSGADWERLGEDAGRIAHFIGNKAYLKMSKGHCAALEIRRDEAGMIKEFFCTIYERRPQICRDLGRGSPECLGELVTKTDRVV